MCTLGLTYIVEEDISKAYLKSLEEVVKQKYVFGLVTKISKPILGSLDEEIDVVESKIKGEMKTYRLIGLNIDKKIHEKFKAFSFYEKKGRMWYGRDKIADRIYELFEGQYHKALEREIRNGTKKLDYVKSHLKNVDKKGNIKGKIHNTFICTIFDSNKHICYPGAPCLISIDFKPKKRKLHLIANWRAQFFNTKAYGNFLSLAMLLRKICKETNFQPGSLISMANKAILEKGVKDELLLENLKETCYS